MRKVSRDKRDDMKSQFCFNFWRSNLICGTTWSRKLPQFLAIEPHFVRKGCAGHLEIAILPLEPHFVRKGCAGHLANRKFTSVFGDRTSFRAKGLRGTTLKSQFYLSFWRSNLISCERVAPDTLKSQFTSVFGDRTSFRAKGLRFVPSRWHCPAPAFRREIEKKERARGQEDKRRRCEGKRARGKKARGEDVKMWGCEDVKMWGWEDVKMSRCEDAKMWRWADVKMRRCEDVKMWRWEDVKMRRCEDEKMRYRPPLLEEPCAQTLSGKRTKTGMQINSRSHALYRTTEKHNFTQVFFHGVFT